MNIATKEWELRTGVARAGVNGTGMVDGNKPVERASDAMSYLSCEKRSEDEKKEEKNVGRLVEFQSLYSFCCFDLRTQRKSESVL